MQNKRGMGVDTYTIIFLTVNLFFFSFLLVFVSNAKDNSLIYEQVYAKQVALLIDSSYPGMVFTLDFDKGYTVAESVNKKSGLLTIDQETHSIKITLKNSGGYLINYLSNYNFKVEEFPESKKIRIRVLKNE